MVGTLLVIGIIAGFALYQYIKGGIVTGFIFLVAVIVAIAAAFGFYESLAAYGKDYSFIGPKAYPLAFFIVFIFVFILIKELADYLLKPQIAFGSADKIAGAAVGALVGYLFSGAILIVIGLTPYKLSWLYQRFEDNISNPPQSSKVMLAPDDFAAGLFGSLSGGCFKGSQTQSFALLHADYVDKIFLCRHKVSEGVWPIAQDGAVSIAPPGLRAAPENLMEAPREQGQPSQQFAPEFDKPLILLRLQINSNLLTPSDGEAESQSKFMLGQLRLIVKDKDAADKNSGSGEAIYPIGYINPAGQIVLKSLDAVLGDEDIKGAADFAFYIPANKTAVMMQFRQNIIEEILPMAAPPVQPPAEAAPPQQSIAEPNIETQEQ